MRLLFFMLACVPLHIAAQMRWENKSQDFGALPSSVQVFFSQAPLDGKPFRAWYVSAELSDKSLLFDTDTTLGRRETPAEFYQRNDQPLVVMNTTFFSFATQQNLNAVITNGKLTGYNVHTIAGRGKDTLTYRHPFTSAIGVNKKRRADVAWLYTDSVLKYPYAIQRPVSYVQDSAASLSYRQAKKYILQSAKTRMRKWKMTTAVGGGPVLVQNGTIAISNDAEWKFAGRAVYDKHPRTAMGYTRDGKLILLVVEGRHPGVAEGADLHQLAQLMMNLGCAEALNLDGGGSSCMLVNGQETIKPSDGKQRPVPAVWIIRRKL